MDFQTCPHCNRDLTGEWLNYEANYNGSRLKEKIECPFCKKDITKEKDSFPSDTVH